MWIRSQDGNFLVNAKAVGISKDLFGKFNYTIFATTDNSRVLIGSYSTEDQAIKVVDRLEKYLQDIEKDIVTGTVFKMPSNDEMLAYEK